MLKSKIGRTIRYGSLFSILTLSRSLPLPAARLALQRAFARKLVEMRGIPTKISQILAMTSPANSDDNLQKAALAEIEPLPVEFARKSLQKNSPQLAREIRLISEKGLAASLGQVHYLQLKSGRELAVKLMYPEIHSQMDFDTNLLRLATEVFETFRQGFALQEYQRVLREELLAELDYEREARVQSLFYRHFESMTDVIIPSVEPESGREQIVMSWEDSLDLDEFKAVASQQEKNQAAALLVQFFCESFFRLGYAHTDPNPGNFGFRRQPVQLVVYDFGSAMHVPRQISLAFLRLLQQVERNQSGVPGLYQLLGFDQQMLLPLRDKLLAFSAMLFEPFLSEQPYALAKWNRRQRAADLLGPERMNFMLAAPAFLFPLMRTFQGLFYYCSQLQADFYARPQIEKLWIENLDQLKELVFLPDESATSMAGYLCIDIREGDEQKLLLHLPRPAIEELEKFIDADVQKKLDERNVNLPEIVRLARQNGYQPMSLFEMETGNKTVKVYLK